VAGLSASTRGGCLGSDGEIGEVGAREGGEHAGISSIASADKRTGQAMLRIFFPRGNSLVLWAGIDKLPESLPDENSAGKPRGAGWARGIIFPGGREVVANAALHPQKVQKG